MKAFRSVSSRLVVAMSGCLLAGTALAAAPAPEPPDVPGSHFTSLENAVTHPTVGCDGAVVQTPQPGTQFADPLRSTPSSAISFYAKAASLHVTWLSTMGCIHTGATHMPTPASPPDLLDAPDSDTIIESSNWSGYEIGNIAQFVQSGWIIPSVAKPIPGGYTTSGLYDSSIWTGLGGALSAADPLIQAGSTQQITTTGVTTYYFWYEVVGGPHPTPGEVRIGDPPYLAGPLAAPGDDVGSASIWLQASDQAELGICNFTHAQCVQFYVSDTPEPGASVEWIVESPRVNGVLQFLPNFGSVDFYNACWASTYTPGEPTDCNGLTGAGVLGPAISEIWRTIFNVYQVNAYPGQITSSGLYDYFQQPQAQPGN
jgi:hypothetical protein